ncbi:MAG: tRNA guanosine(34) transglycosylase Tgt [Elusimicrobiota bacterium]
MKNFLLHKKDGKSYARAGLLKTPHGEIHTPAFIPVGTQGTVKTLDSTELLNCGVEVIQGNAYHLYFRPGVEIVKQMGGLHKFCSWERSILTDSGGFQVFSLSGLRKITDAGVEFKYPPDGSTHMFTPEKSIEIQYNLGADLIMCFDECVPYPTEKEYAEKALLRTIQWAKRCKDKFDSLCSAIEEVQRPLLLGIVQGSVFPELRKMSAELTLEIGFDGYALGGLSVGEPKPLLYEITQSSAGCLPDAELHYLMGVGTPEDLWECVSRGIDLFDCVQPTRNARNGQVFTRNGKLNMRNSIYKTDPRPFDPLCHCPVCKKYSRAYVNHLFHANEILAPRLNTLHNIFFMIELTKIIRESIIAGDFTEKKEVFLKNYTGGVE